MDLNGSTPSGPLILYGDTFDAVMTEAADLCVMLRICSRKTAERELREYKRQLKLDETETDMPGKLLIIPLEEDDPPCYSIYLDHSVT